MESSRCAACGEAFRPCPKTPHQQFCSAHACQQERRRRWRRAKLVSDPDYRDNQARAQRAWIDRHPGYWDDYRRLHPEYVQRNRTQQRERRASGRPQGVAKMNELPANFPPKSGIYKLSPVASKNVAKIDALMVEIVFISDA